MESTLSVHSELVASRFLDLGLLVYLALPSLSPSFSSSDYVTHLHVVKKITMANFSQKTPEISDSEPPVASVNVSMHVALRRIDWWNLIELYIGRGFLGRHGHNASKNLPRAPRISICSGSHKVSITITQEFPINS